jgi:16S rRNA (guanine527-N7)-methyltransferase
MTPRTFSAALRERSRELRLTVPPGLLPPLERYYQLLARWNRRINLTSLELDEYPPATLDRLILEAVAAASAVASERGPWFDIGSGGGSPAIPLRLLHPIPLTMVEPKGRKVAFLREAIRTLELGRVEVLPRLVQDLGEEYREAADLVTVRAVRIDEPVLVGLKSLLRPAGRLLIFGAGNQPLSGLEPVRDFALPGHSTLRLYRRL